MLVWDTSRDHIGADLPLNVSLARVRVLEESRVQSIPQHTQPMVSRFLWVVCVVGTF